MPPRNPMNWQRKYATDSFLKVGSTPNPTFGLDVISMNDKLERDLTGVILDEENPKKLKKRKSKKNHDGGLVERIFPRPNNVPPPLELNQLFQHYGTAAHIRKKIPKDQPLFFVDKRRWNLEIYAQQESMTGEKNEKLSQRRLSHGDVMNRFSTMDDAELSELEGISG
jgi:hypothetical protein